MKFYLGWLTKIYCYSNRNDCVNIFKKHNDHVIFNVAKNSRVAYCEFLVVNNNDAKAKTEML